MGPRLGSRAGSSIPPPAGCQGILAAEFTLNRRPAGLMAVKRRKVAVVRDRGPAPASEAAPFDMPSGSAPTLSPRA